MNMPDFAVYGDLAYRKKRSNLVREAGYWYEKAANCFVNME